MRRIPSLWLCCALASLLPAVVPFAGAQAPGDGAEVRPSESSVPASIAPGETAPVRIRVYNTGSTTWKKEGGLPYPYRLGASFYADSFNQTYWVNQSCGGYQDEIWNARVYLCDDVLPGGFADLNFAIQLPPGSSGSVRLAVQMVQEAGTAFNGWFGNVAVWNVSVGTPSGGNNAEIRVGESSVPGSLAAGETATVRIRLYNSGSTTWTQGTMHRLAAEGSNQVLWSGFPCGGYANSLTDARAFLCSDVLPGGSSDFTFDITVPTGASGSVSLAVRMVQDGVEFFGQSFAWAVTVTGGGPICPNGGLAIPNDRWRLEIWNNRGQAGSTVEQRYDAPGGGGFAFDWNAGGPSPCTGSEDYAVRFTRTAFFPTSGTHTFTTTVDDGVQFRVDGSLLIDEWRDPQVATFSASQFVSAGVHNLQLDYYQAFGGANVSLSWALETPPPSPPLPPTEVAATAGDRQVSLAWNASVGATSYRVKRGTTSGAHATVAMVTFTGYTDGGLANGTTYYYVVTAVNSVGESGESNEASATPAPSPPTQPPAPTGLAAAAGVGQVSLGWNASAGATSYNVKRGTSPGSHAYLATVFSPGYTDTAVTSGTTYYYVVTAVNGAGESGESNEATATPTAPPESMLQIGIVDPSGAPVADGQTLGQNADGWPSPNGLTVRATLTCPPAGAIGCRGFEFKLVVDSPGDAARFYMEAISAAGCSVDGPLSRSSSPYSFEALTWRCRDGASTGMELRPGESRTLTWALMVQPSDWAALNLSGTWRAASDRLALGIDRTAIHPVIVIPGILGTMPPSTLIGQLDPVLGVYNPLLIELQKMGYVDGLTLKRMPYDWRRSNHETAGHLRDVIGWVLSDVSALPFVNQDGKVDLVVHSMGGLVTRTYVQGQAVDWLGNPAPYRNDVRKVVFSATPHRGFPEDYRTYEGVTWDMYLYDDFFPGLAMQTVFWPAFVEKRWRAQHLPFIHYIPYPAGTPFQGRVMCLYSPVLDCSGFISPTLTYRMMHDSVGGTDSLREMLPTKDSDAYWPYLCDSAPGAVCTGSYPYGQQLNPLLDGPGGLNASVLDLARNLDPVPGRGDPVEGAKNIYVIFGHDPVRPIDQTDAFYVVGPPVGGFGITLFWQNGTPQQNYVTNEGDDLIPTYSMNLKLLLPDIPAANVKILSGGSARHKQIMFDRDYQSRWVPRFLAGLGPLPFVTPYVKPPFLIDPAQWWTLAALCPVNLTVTDPQGRRAGFNSDTGGTFDEIPGAVYAAAGSPDGQFIILPDPVSGTYQITATGFDRDSFSLVLSQVTRAGAFRRFVADGQTEPGKADQFTVEIDTTLPDEQHRPVASAGPDQTVPAGPDCGASVALDGSGSSDPDGEILTYVWTGPFGVTAGSTPTVMLPLGRHTLTLTVQDGQAASATDTVVVTVADAAPPTIHNLSAKPEVIEAGPGLVDVTVTAGASDTCSGVTCRIAAVTSNEPAGGSEPDWEITGPLTVRLRAERSAEGSGRVYTLSVRCADAAGNVATKTVAVRVPPAGRMSGHGRLESNGLRYHFDFDVWESVRGREGGDLRLRVKPRRHDDDDDDEDEDDDDDGDDHHGDRFEATKITEAVFSDAEDLDPQPPPARVDTVRFRGQGRWNGASGYTFEATATDAGEPGAGRDRFSITIWDNGHRLVVNVSGLIVSGNNQAKRPPN